jgi:hypothetical protein
LIFIPFFSYSHLQRLYPEITSLKYIISIETIPFEPEQPTANVAAVHHITDSVSENSSKTLSSLSRVNNLNIKRRQDESLWTHKQLDPFINKLSNRDNYESKRAN